MATGADVAVIGEILIEISADDLPSLRIDVRGSAVSVEGEWSIVPERLYRIEKSRGYKYSGTLWSPGTIVIALTASAMETTPANPSRRRSATILPRKTT